MKANEERTKEEELVRRGNSLELNRAYASEDQGPKVLQVASQQRERREAYVDKMTDLILR